MEVELTEEEKHQQEEERYMKVIERVDRIYNSLKQENNNPIIKDHELRVLAETKARMRLDDVCRYYILNWLDMNEQERNGTKY